MLWCVPRLELKAKTNHSLLHGKKVIANGTILKVLDKVY